MEKLFVAFACLVILNGFRREWMGLRHSPDGNEPESDAGAGSEMEGSESISEIGSILGQRNGESCLAAAVRVAAERKALLLEKEASDQTD